MKRYEVSDAQFALVADLFPANGRRGGQWRELPSGTGRGRRPTPG